MHSCARLLQPSRARISLLAAAILPTLVTACSPDVISPDSTPSGISLLETGGSWTIKATMPTPRGRLKAATVNGVVYAIGGYAYATTGEYVVRAKVEAYNAATNTWTGKKRLPEPLAPNGATTINGKIYVAGGKSNDRISKALYVYDPASDIWTRKADMPFTVAPGTGHQGTINSKLYIYAGVTINPDGSIGPHRFFRYNPATNIWVNLGRPSYARSGGASGVINGRFYLVGGTLPLSRNGGGRAYDVHIYDPASGWSKIPLGPVPGNLSYATVGGKLYMTGAWYDGDCKVPRGGIYDPDNNTLAAFDQSPPWVPSDAAGAAAKGQFFVLGGNKHLGPGLYGCYDGFERLPGAVEAYTP